MLESFLGETDFRNGVTKYLDTHKWGNAKNADLWKALSEVLMKIENESREGYRH